jgi:predicted metal-dependent phosphoesterase TrpH
MKADLHLHTTASDGRLTPAEIVRLAAEQGLNVIAIADHDSVAGIIPALQAAQAFPSLKIIPGIEIGTDIPQGEVHILGYFVDYTAPELLARLEGLRNSRRDRALRMIAKLRDLGIHIEWRRVQELARGGSIGRPHIAQAMLERGYIPSIKEAFSKYIGRESPAYAERRKMPPEQAVELVASFGGLPVLAHPADIDDVEALILKLKADTMNTLSQIGHRHGLVLCGGSDYHGFGSGAESMPSQVNVPPESIEQLIALAGERATELMLP